MSRFQMGSWVFALCMLVSGGASAQVKEGSFVLSLDTSLVSFQRFKAEAEGDSETTQVLAFGPLQLGQSPFATVLDLGAGYVVHKHFIPSLGFSFGVSKTKYKYDYGSESDDEDGARVGVIALQPRVEVPFNPDGKVVWGALVGFDFRRAKITETYTDEFDSEQEEDTKLFGYGAVGGIQAHVFLVEQLSLDFGAFVQFDKIKYKDLPDGLSQTALNAGLKVGLSGWL